MHLLLDTCSFLSAVWFTLQLYLLNIRRQLMMELAKKTRYRDVRVQTTAMWFNFLIVCTGVSTMAMILLFFLRYYLRGVVFSTLGVLVLLGTWGTYGFLRYKLKVTEDQPASHWKNRRPSPLAKRQR